MPIVKTAMLGVARRIGAAAFHCSLAVLAATGIYAMALVSADPLLVERDGLMMADIIVVLGGDGPPRAALGAALWLQGTAPSVLVTGQGDCNSIKQTMIEAGVAPTAVFTECLSMTTWENAAFSQPVLKRMEVKRAILVTSWFHSRRAIKRFRQLMPEVRWSSIPAERAKSLLVIARDADGIQIFKEYAKTVVYDLRSLLTGIASLSKSRKEAAP